MKRSTKLIGVTALIVLLALTFAAPARAFDGRGGDKVTIAAGEVVNDDLYIGANEVVIDGTVNGDVIAFGSTITINGTVNGDVMAAGQTVVINGTVADDARIAGSVLYVGDKAKIGSDLLGAGYSLETRQDSTVGQDVVGAAGQILLAGDIKRNVQVAGGGFELRGNVGGNVKAEVGEAEGNPPMTFPMQSTVPVPSVQPGLKIDPSAHIGGNLEYTQTKELTFPAGVVAGKIKQIVPQVNEAAAAHKPTQAERVGTWALDMLRSAVTLILIGLLFIWLFPNFLGITTGKLQTSFWPSLGWGIVTYALFFFALFLIILLVVAGGIFFGVLTLGGLSGTVIWLGILALFAGILGFVLATAYVTKVLVGTMLGKWILKYISPAAAQHRVWPMVVGVLVIVLVIGMLRFPLAPLGFFGWLLNFAIILFGLGALWLWGREKFVKKPAAPVVSVPTTVE